MKNKGKFFSGSVFLVVLATIALLPTLLSIPPVQRFLLQRYNQQAAMTMSMDSCTLRWRGTLACRNMILADTNRGVSVSVEKVSSHRGLLWLLINPKNLGQWVLDKPVVRFILDSRDTPNKKDPAQNTSFKPISGNLPPANDSGKDDVLNVTGKPIWEGYRLEVQVRNGVLDVDFGDKAHGKFGGVFDLNAGLTAGSVTYDLQLEIGQEKGDIKASGFFNLPVRKQSILSTLVSDSEVEITAMDITPFFNLLGPEKGFFLQKTIIGGKYRVVTSGVTDLHLKGQTVLHGVHLKGAALGDDQPVFDKIVFNLDGGKNIKEGWFLSSFFLESDMGRVTASGHYSEQGNEAHAIGLIDLEQLFDQFPDSLAIHQDTRIDSGKLSFEASLIDTDEIFTVEAQGVVDRLHGQQGSKLFEWEKPVSLDIRIAEKGDILSVEHFSAKAPFIQMTASGQAEEFSFQLRADLDAAYQELAKLFVMDYSPHGVLKGTGTVTISEPEHVQMDLDLVLDDFSLTRGPTEIFPAHTLTVKGHAEGPFSWLQGNESAQFEVKGTGWPGDLFFSVDDCFWQDKALCALYDGHGSINIDRMVGILRNLNLLNPTLEGKGQFVFDGAGTIGEKTLGINRLNAKVEKLRVDIGRTRPDQWAAVSSVQRQVQKTTPIALRKLVVAGQRTLAFQNGRAKKEKEQQKKNLVLNRLALDAGSIALTESSLRVDDWQQPFNSFHGAINAKVEAAFLTKFTRSAGKMPVTVEGTTQAIVHAQANPSKASTATIDLYLDKFDIWQGDRQFLVNRQVSLNTALEGTKLSGDIKASNVSLGFPPFKVEGTVHLNRDNRPSISAQGTVIPDWNVVSRDIESRSGHKVFLAGDKPNSFQLYYPLQLSVAETKKNMAFQWDLGLNRFEYAGIDIRQLSLPLRVKNGSISCDLKGEINGGIVTTSLRSDVLAKTSILRIPPSSQVLKGVQLEKPLVDGILGKIHPIFGVFTRPEGTLDMYMDEFSWPLQSGGGNRARFVAVLDVSQVRLDTTGILTKVLSVLQMESDSLLLKDSELICDGQNGRIHCTPVHILVDNVEVIISGSAGMDGTLDYLFEIPVNEAMIGREGYRLLGGTSLKIPIKGSLGEPIFNRAMALSALEVLMEDTARQGIEKQIEKLLPQLWDDVFGQ